MKVRFRSRSQRVFRKRREIHHRVDPVQVTERDVADGASDSRDVGDGRLVSELTAPVGIAVHTTDRVAAFEDYRTRLVPM
jgi:hypothetical protein